MHGTFVYCNKPHTHTYSTNQVHTQCCTYPINRIFVPQRVAKSTLHYCISDRVAQLLIYFLKPPDSLEASTEALNEAKPSISNLLANTKATKSPNGAQLSITNLPAKTKAMSNTQHRNSLSVTNKENINNKSGHSTATLRKCLNTPVITKTKCSTHAINNYR